MPSHKWAVGDRFTVSDSRKWTDKDGKVQYDTYTIEGRVTEIDGFSAMWKREHTILVQKTSPFGDLSSLVPDSGGFSLDPELDKYRECRFKYLPGEKVYPPLWEVEFGKSFPMPQQIRDKLTLGELDDTSYHNDICPSVQIANDERFRLWIEWEDRDKREQEEWFCVTSTQEAEEEPHHINYTEFYKGEDVNKALETLFALPAQFVK